MATEAQVANLAALTIGTEHQLTSLAEDTHIARTLRAAWDIERRSTLRAGIWNFAVRRAALAADAGVPSAQLYPWAYRYTLPADCLRFVEILGLVARDAYAIEGGAVMCDVSAPLYVRYCADVPEPTRWTDDFANAFAYRLALVCGDRIAGSAFDSGAAQAKLEAAIASVARVDGLEDPPIEQEDGSWITARLCGSGYRRPGWEIG